jgi:hypothetical protein
MAGKRARKSWATAGGAYLFGIAGAAGNPHQRCLERGADTTPHPLHVLRFASYVIQKRSLEAELCINIVLDFSEAQLSQARSNSVMLFII